MTKGSFIAFTPAPMEPASWKCLCPVCHWRLDIDDETLEIEGTPEGGEIYSVSIESGARWFRCDNCDTALEIQSAVTSPRRNGGA